MHARVPFYNYYITFDIFRLGNCFLCIYKRNIIMMYLFIKKEPHLTLLKSETCFQHDIILQNRKCITCADVRVLNRWIPVFV